MVNSKRLAGTLRSETPVGCVYWRLWADGRNRLIMVLTDRHQVLGKLYRDRPIDNMGDKSNRVDRIHRSIETEVRLNSRVKIWC